jgi:GT2 family glycosyltransferase
MSPLVSIIIVNWNGRKWLEKCLNSLFLQAYKNFEIICVDNASSDDSVSYMREHYSDVRIIESTVNLGFAGGNNLGLTEAK